MTEHLHSRWEAKHPNAQPIRPPFTLNNLNMVLAALPEDFAASAPGQVCPKHVSELQLRCVGQPFFSLLRENAYSQLLSHICKDWPAVCESALKTGAPLASAPASADRGHPGMDQPLRKSADGLPQEYPALGSSHTAHHADAQVPAPRVEGSPPGSHPSLVSKPNAQATSQREAATGAGMLSPSELPSAGTVMPAESAAQEAQAPGACPSQVQPSSRHVGRAQHCGTAAAEPSSQDASGRERTDFMPLFPHIDRPLSSNLQGQAQQDARQLLAAGASIGAAAAELASRDTNAKERNACMSFMAATERPASSSLEDRPHRDARQPSAAAASNGTAARGLSSQHHSETELAAVPVMASSSRPTNKCQQHRTLEAAGQSAAPGTSNGPAAAAAEAAAAAAKPIRQHSSETEPAASLPSGADDDTEPSRLTDDAAIDSLYGQPSLAAEVQSSGNVMR